MNKEAIDSETARDQYTERLLRIQEARWKRLFNVQAPYRWNLQRLQLGFTLDIGCGIGRNLMNLNGYGVGVDHNESSVELAGKRGVRAYTPEGFWKSEFTVSSLFDSLLLAHVAEHMTMSQVTELLLPYVPLVKKSGKIILITPQEAGFRSDATHEQFMDFPLLEIIVNELGADVQQRYSFPFPRIVGKVFKHNEFVVVGTLR